MRSERPFDPGRSGHFFLDLLYTSLLSKFSLSRWNAYKLLFRSAFCSTRWGRGCRRRKLLWLILNLKNSMKKWRRDNDRDLKFQWEGKSKSNSTSLREAKERRVRSSTVRKGLRASINRSSKGVSKEKPSSRRALKK